MLPFAQAREGAGEAVRLLRVLEARLARDTVNIGVSGQARVGKSTLLQSVSGLGDDQIPTGQALPVTAVRSRIFHAPDLRRATLRLHSFDTFVTDVIAPYHAELDIAGLPGTPEEFRHWPYPKPSQPPGSPASAGCRRRVEELRLTAAPDDAPEDRPSWVTMLNRLRAMQQSFPTYEHDLTGGERVLPLEELRPWVAYPTNAEEQQPGRGRAAVPRGPRRPDRLPLPARPGAAPGDRGPARARRVRRAGRRAPRRRPAERGGRRAAGEAAGRGHGLLGRRGRPRARPDRLRPRLRGPAGLRRPRAEHGRHLRRPAHRPARPHPRPGQQRRARPVLPGAGVRRRRRGRRVRPRPDPRAGAPRGPDAGDGRRRGGRHPGRAARRRPADRDAHRRRGAGAGVGGAVVRERGGGSRPAVAAAAPGPVGGARRAGRRAARAGPGGRGGPGLHRRRGARVRHHARMDHGRARDRRAGVARRGAARHDGGPQQQPLRRRRAEPGPGGDQQLFRGDRRLLRRAGAGAVGSGRGDHPGAARARCSGDAATGDDALRRFVALLAEASEPCPRLRQGRRATAHRAAGLPLPAASPGARGAGRVDPAGARPGHRRAAQPGRRRGLAGRCRAAVRVRRADGRAGGVPDEEGAAAARGRHPGAGAARGGRAAGGHDDPVRGLRAGVQAARPLLPRRALAGGVRRDRRRERARRLGGPGPRRTGGDHLGDKAISEEKA